MNEPPRQPFTLAVFTKNRVNPAYDAARLAVLLGLRHLDLVDEGGAH